MMVRARRAGIGMGNKETRKKKRRNGSMLDALHTGDHQTWGGIGLGSGILFTRPGTRVRPLEKWELAAPCK